MDDAICLSAFTMIFIGGYERRRVFSLVLYEGVGPPLFRVTLPTDFYYYPA